MDVFSHHSFPHLQRAPCHSGAMCGDVRLVCHQHTSLIWHPPVNFILAIYKRCWLFKPTRHGNFFFSFCLTLFTTDVVKQRGFQENDRVARETLLGYSTNVAVNRERLFETQKNNPFCYTAQHFLTDQWVSWFRHLRQNDTNETIPNFFSFFFFSFRQPSQTRSSSTMLDLPDCLSWLSAQK